MDGWMECAGPPTPIPRRRRHGGRNPKSTCHAHACLCPGIGRGRASSTFPIRPPPAPPSRRSSHPPALPLPRLRLFLALFSCATYSLVLSRSSVAWLSFPAHRRQTTATQRSRSRKRRRRRRRVRMRKVRVGEKDEGGEAEAEVDEHNGCGGGVERDEELSRGGEGLRRRVPAVVDSQPLLRSPSYAVRQRRGRGGCVEDMRSLAAPNLERRLRRAWCWVKVPDPGD
ncbi:hypothetical protein B0H11DRAFT_818982 [Mycena galericulata]|nr:hypothetical protein B0H11DRAFT_818982 [Mycena galericulata]